MCVLRGEMCSLGEKKLLEAAVTIAKAECWLGAGRGFALRQTEEPLLFLLTTKATRHRGLQDGSVCAAPHSLPHPDTCAGKELDPKHHRQPRGEYLTHILPDAWHGRPAPPLFLARRNGMK